MIRATAGAEGKRGWVARSRTKLGYEIKLVHTCVVCCASLNLYSHLHHLNQSLCSFVIICYHDPPKVNACFHLKQGQVDAVKKIESNQREASWQRSV